jgi:hypothetical protein
MRPSTMSTSCGSRPMSYFGRAPSADAGGDRPDAWRRVDAPSTRRRVSPSARMSSTPPRRGRSRRCLSYERAWLVGAARAGDSGARRLPIRVGADGLGCGGSGRSPEEAGELGPDPRWTGVVPQRTRQGSEARTRLHARSSSPDPTLIVLPDGKPANVLHGVASCRPSPASIYSNQEEGTPPSSSNPSNNFRVQLQSLIATAVSARARVASVSTTGPMP